MPSDTRYSYASTEPFAAQLYFAARITREGNLVSQLHEARFSRLAFPTAGPLFPEALNYLAALIERDGCFPDGAEPSPVANLPARKARPWPPSRELYEQEMEIGRWHRLAAALTLLARNGAYYQPCALSGHVRVTCPYGEGALPRDHLQRHRQALRAGYVSVEAQWNDTDHG